LKKSELYSVGTKESFDEELTIFAELSFLSPSPLPALTASLASVITYILAQYRR